MNDADPGNDEPRRARALDPSTPTEELCELALEYPLEVTDNPVFLFLLIENPGLLDEWRTRDDLDASLALLSRGRLPGEMLRAFALDGSRPKRRQQVAANPFLPPDLFPILLRDRSDVLLSGRIAANPSLPEPLLRAMAARKVDHVRAGAASNPSLPLEDLVRLSFDEGPGVRVATLRQPRLPASRVRALMADLDRSVQSAALGHPEHDKDLARMLHEAAQGCGWSPERMIRLPVETMEALAVEGPHARLLAASHPEAPPSLLERLARDDCPAVVEAAAANPTTPPEVLASLQRTTRLREALLKNPATLPGLLDAVADESMRSIAAEGRAALMELRLKIVSHPKASAGLLDQLSEAPDLKLHGRIASHPNTSASTLARLSGSRNAKARAAVARHPACPPEVRATLANDLEARVRRAAGEARGGEEA
jgi:hypothetical protein